MKIYRDILLKEPIPSYLLQDGDFFMDDKAPLNQTGIKIYQVHEILYFPYKIKYSDITNNEIKYNNNFSIYVRVVNEFIEELKILML